MVTQLAADFDAHGKHAQAVAFSRDGRTLVSVGQDQAVRVWGLPGAWPRGELRGHNQCVSSVSLAPDGEHLATGGSDGTVRVWSLTTGDCESVLPKQTGGRYAPDGRSLMTTDAAGRVTLWDAGTGDKLRTIDTGKRRVTAACWSPHGPELLLGTCTQRNQPAPILRVDPDTGDTRATLDGHTHAVQSLDVDPAGRWLASTGSDGTLRRWAIPAGREAACADLPVRGVLCARHAPDGRTLAVGGDYALLLIDAATLALRERIDVPIKGVYGLAWSPDGRWLANAGADGHVRVWRVRAE